LLTKKDIEHINETTLTKYEFMWDDEYEAIALGYGSLYNHSEEPNVEWDRDFERKLFVFTALKDVEPGEELTIDYFPDDPKEDFPEEYLDFMH
jgi:SET domain-containing protein